MGIAIQFYAQFGLGAVKIYDKFIDRMLPAEFVVQVPVPKGLPEGGFSRCLGVSHLAGTPQNGRIDSITFFHRSALLVISL